MLVYENFGTLDKWIGQNGARSRRLRKAQARYEPGADARVRLMYGTDRRS